MNRIAQLIDSMTAYYANDPRRTAHFLKVYAYAKTIAHLEEANDATRLIIEAAAVVHDIGIKVSEQKYHSSAGKYQELEGPPLAREMLNSLGFSQEVTERVCFLVGHHHSYADIDGEDYRILVEADLLVNIQEDGISAESAYAACDKLFRSPSAIAFLHRLFEDAGYS